MNEDEVARAADHVKAHPLAEKTLWTLPLHDVKVILEGTDAEGNVIRFRSAAQVDVHKPDNLAIVEVQPLERSESLLQISRPAEYHIVLVGQLVPAAPDGVVYHIEQLKERTL